MGNLGKKTFTKDSLPQTTKQIKMPEVKPPKEQEQKKEKGK